MDLLDKVIDKWYIVDVKYEKKDKNGYEIYNTFQNYVFGIISKKINDEEIILDVIVFAYIYCEDIQFDDGDDVSATSVPGLFGDDDSSTSGGD